MPSASSSSLTDVGASRTGSPAAIRLLIAYVTAGAGHRRAAEALAQAARARFPHADIQCVDVLEHAPAWCRLGYAWTYLVLVRYLPWLWKFGYQVLERPAVYRRVQPLRRRWNLFIAGRFIQRLRAAPPDGILVTHFLPADVCSAGKRAGWLAAPVVVVVTDLYPHRFWISREPEALVISTPEGARLLQERGVAPERIRVLGIPIGARFGLAADRQALQARYRLDPKRLTVLVTSGGTTVGRFREVVESLMRLEASCPGRLQLLVVCGHDRRAHEALIQRADESSMPVRVFGFIDFMDELMHLSDLIVAKAGGLTVSEALGCGVPVIVYHVIPGQEQLNALHVVSHGAGLLAPTPSGVAEAVRRCLEAPQALQSMARAAKALGHPDTAQRIITDVLQPLLTIS